MSQETESRSVHGVIVNYRTPALCVDAIQSLRAERGTVDDLRITVVDNASGDGSRETLATATADHPEVAFLPLDENGGFAAGNDVALDRVLGADEPPRYVLLLNPDTVVRPGAIRALVEHLESHPEIGIAGSRLEDPDGTPQRSAFRFPSVLGELEHTARFGPLSRLLRRWVVAPPVVDEPIETDWVAGASMLVRREVFDAIGRLDPVYFLYYEEVDFCLAARRSGWRCAYVPASRVVHLVGQASGVTNPDSVKRRPAYWFESRRRYFAKNHGRLYTALADLAWIMGYLSWRIRRWIQRKPDPDPPHFLADFVRHSIWARGGRT
ncbi:MAG: glycosyltransferase family 2 protein [Planctomycetes bacterium]|nr:glycosyltransferase family 2 protein [Planctomycetota bacterium]